MRRSIALLFAALAATVVSACAPTEGGAARSRFSSADGQPDQCFQPARVINFRSGGSQQVYLRVLGGAVFEVSSAGCLDFGSTNGLAIAPSIGVSDRLCVGDGARITLLNPSTPQGACPARIVRSLTDAEIEALPSRQRP